MNKDGLSFEEYLERFGTLTYANVGVSMMPLLRQGKDLFTVQKKGGERCKRGDVVLYTRPPDQYVLHRVIGEADGVYLIRGDNTFSVERVPFDSVIGVLTAFNRKGKMHAVTERGYRFYAAAWNAIYPLRALWRRIRRLLIIAAKKIGILPLLKKWLRR